jgi:hypothetical protein
VKKIPCLFVRTFTPRANGRGMDVTLTRDVTPGCEWVFEGLGVATRKWDGTACLVKDGVLYKRYDAKAGKPPPANGIPCEEAPDPETGHWPHWAPVGDEPASKWHLAAWNRLEEPLRDGTYELVGPHFAPHEEAISEAGLDVFVRHGAHPLGPPRTFDGLKEFFEKNLMEGIVFWLNGEPQCKIRRADYGLPWGNKRG